MLSVFGDESTDENQQRVFAVAGVIGSDEQWEHLEQLWVNRTGGIPFHANDCDSDRGSYAATPHAGNKALYRDLTVLLAESGLGGYGFAVDLIALRQVFPDAPDIAYYKCFLEVLQKMRNCAAYNGESVKFTFDSRMESEHNTGLLYGMFRGSSEWSHILFPFVGFAVSRELPEIQVADLFARETMKALDNIIGPVKRPPRKSMQALLATGRFDAEAVSTDWFIGLKRKMPTLEREAGMSEGQYRTWLAGHRLQHNTTNMFRYLQWCENRDKV